jgi:hypothetical protein
VPWRALRLAVPRHHQTWEPTLVLNQRMRPGGPRTSAGAPDATQADSDIPARRCDGDLKRNSVPRLCRATHPSKPRLATVSTVSVAVRAGHRRFTSPRKSRPAASRASVHLPFTRSSSPGFGIPQTYTPNSDCLLGSRAQRRALVNARNALSSIGEGGVGSSPTEGLGQAAARPGSER